MKGKPIITRIEVREFEYQINDTKRSTSAPIYEPGAVLNRRSHVIRVFTDTGITGEYVGGNPVEYAALPMFVHTVIGRNALDREAIYNDAKQALRQRARMGMSQVDMALWDLAGKYYGAPVYELLGGYRTSIPCYASTYIGDDRPEGLNSPEAYAEFAQQCLELGYPAYKIHAWEKAPIEKHIAVNHAVARKVGGKMDLMVDPFCIIDTFGEAVKLGWSCDEEKFFWWEDPFKDGGVSAFAHRKLRQLVKTPLLQMEHIRGLESHVDFIVADGSDFVRGDPDYDGGITGIMKIAHAAEGFGLDIELHVGGPERRHLMAAIRNSNYYEMGLLHPKVKQNLGKPPVYKNYQDGLEAVDRNGCISVPQGPGLGVELDWEYINKHTTSVVTYD